MFRPFLEQARSVVSAAVSKYQGRALVAALAVVAACFAVAAAAILLSNAFGPVIACLILAAAFALGALIAASWTGASERRQEEAIRVIAEDKAPVISAALAAAAPMALAQGASVIMRRAPIIVLLVLGGLFLQSFGNRPARRK